MALLSRLIRAREGSVLVLGALSLTGVIGSSALAVEGGQLYAAKVRNQRVADMAALAAAVAYQGGATLAAATETAKDVAAASGLGRTDATVQSVDAGTALTVSVATPVPVTLGHILKAAPSFTVRNVAKASLVTVSPSTGCITALSAAGDYGVTLSGGTSITASGCDLVTNSGVSVPWGTSVTAKGVTAGKAVYDPGSGVSGTVTQNKSGAAKDNVAGDARVVAGLAKVGSFTAPVANSNPTTPTGVDWIFPNGEYAFDQLPASDPVKANCRKSGSGLACNGGSYAIRAFKPSSMAVTFTGPVDLTISAGLSAASGRLTFAGGTIAINGGLNTGSSGITFGNATVTVGAGTLTFRGDSSFGNGNVSMNGVLSLGGGANVTMGRGAHSFNGLSVSGGSTLVLGAGSLNLSGALADDGGGSSITVGDGPVAIGRDASGNAVTVAGSSSLVFGDGAWSANGRVATSGGSQLTFGDTDSHYINGELDLSGSATLGTGAYYINGSLTNNAGGTMTGAGVTLFLAGTFALSGGTSMTLTAPTSDTGGGVTDLLVATRSAGNFRLGGGSQNKYAGLVYAPNSALVMEGGAGVTGGGRCFMLVVSTLSLSGGTSTATRCATIGGSTAATGSVALLQ